MTHSLTPPGLLDAKRRDQIPLAIAAHRLLVKQVTEDLTTVGTTDEQYFRLVMLLAGHLGADGYWTDKDGSWYDSNDPKYAKQDYLNN
jgi:hypothetical protein